MIWPYRFASKVGVSLESGVSVKETCLSLFKAFFSPNAIKHNMSAPIEGLMRVLFKKKIPLEGFNAIIFIFVR